VERFREALTKLGIKKNQEAYVDHCAKGDLEDLEDVSKRLHEMGLHHSLCSQAVIFWAGDIKIPVPQKLQKRLDEGRSGKTFDESEEGKDPEKYSIDPESGAIKVASTTDKKALTWDEAEKLSTRITKETGGSAESPFIPNAEGNLVINPKAKITGVEVMAYEVIRKAQERGEPVNPLAALAQAAEQMKIYREALGGGENAKADWMSDPVAFIKAIREITGGEGKGDDAIKTELAELRRTLVDMKDERHKQELGSLQGQILQMQKNHETEMKTIVEKIEESKNKGGKTEMDILHEVATEGMSVAKTELAGMRGMIKEALGSVALPGAKTSEQREARKGQIRQALETDQDIDRLGKKLFLGES